MNTLFLYIYLLLEMLVLPHWYAKQSESLIQHSLLQEPRSQGDINYSWNNHEYVTKITSEYLERVNLQKVWLTAPPIIILICILDARCINLMHTGCVKRRK